MLEAFPSRRSGDVDQGVPAHGSRPPYPLRYSDPYTPRMYPVYVPRICTPYRYPLQVPRICTPYRYPVYVPRIGTPHRYPAGSKTGASGSATPAGTPAAARLGGGVHERAGQTERGGKEYRYRVPADAPLPGGGAGPDLRRQKVHERAEKEAGVDGEGGGGMVVLARAGAPQELGGGGGGGDGGRRRAQIARRTPSAARIDTLKAPHALSVRGASGAT